MSTAKQKSVRYSVTTKDILGTKQGSQSCPCSPGQPLGGPMQTKMEEVRCRGEEEVKGGAVIATAQCCNRVLSVGLGVSTGCERPPPHSRLC